MSQGCQQCLAGNHRSCDGRAWDEAESRYVPCPCAQSRHMERRQL